MKILGFIFSFYILFLAVLPGLKGIALPAIQKVENCCGNTCDPIEKRESKLPSEKEESPDNKACNPFQSCKCCVSWNPEFALSNFTQVILFTQQLVENTEKIPPKISLDFWQPPKIG